MNKTRNRTPEDDESKRPSTAILTTLAGEEKLREFKSMSEKSQLTFITSNSQLSRTEHPKEADTIFKRRIERCCLALVTSHKAVQEALIQTYNPFDAEDDLLYISACLKQNPNLDSALKERIIQMEKSRPCFESTGASEELGHYTICRYKDPDQLILSGAKVEFNEMLEPISLQIYMRYVT